MNLVDVIIATFNAEPVLPACLSALQDGTEGINAIVADNASTDRTLAVAHAYGASVVEIGRNAGFGAASNAGARTGCAPILLFLNPDAVAAGADILKAADALRRLGAGALGCRLVKPDGTLDHAAKRMIVRPLEAARFLVRRTQSSPYLAPHVGEFDTGEVDSVNGAFLMVPRQVFEEIGGFDERFWMYLEDVDLCARVKESGRPVMYWPGVTALHIKSATSGKSRSPRLNYHFHKSMWIFYRKHQAGSDNALKKACVLVGIAARCSWVALRDMYRRSRGVGLPVNEPALLAAAAGVSSPAHTRPGTSS